MAGVPQPCQRQLDKRKAITARRRLSCGSRSSPPRPGLPDLPPAKIRCYELENALDRVGVVLDAELVRDSQQQRVGGLDRRVPGELLHEDVGFCGVRTSEDRLRLRIDVADLVRLL